MRYLFEVSWEVCNLVGGIHTVLRTKAAQAKNHVGDTYFLLGPKLDHNTEFLPQTDEVFARIAPALEEKGLRCTFGRWDIPASPRVILVDFRDRYDSGKLLYQYWQRFGVDSMGSGWDYIEPVLFSTACGEVIETVHGVLAGPQDETIAQFHEWMSGAGMLHIKKTSPEIGTVFSTHATILGRSMSGAGVDIYSDDVVIDPVNDARAYGVPSKASMESVCAREADVFTTVSDVTAEEAFKILGRRPHFAVFNGIDLNQFDPLDVLAAKRAAMRKQLRTTASVFLGEMLPEDTRFWATSGRYEFRNKGYDILLESLARLNRTLSASPDSPPVVAWFLIATGNNGIKTDLYDNLKNGVVESADYGLSTHHLHDEFNDPIVATCRKLGLTNQPGHKVKVIFTPAYITPEEPLFGAGYYDVVNGFDVGIFPSAYEPWGYTPLECVALGIPTITSDLAGFGRWVRDCVTDNKGAVTIVSRQNTPTDTSTGQLTEALERLYALSEAQWNTVRRHARRIAEQADWKYFFDNYIRAYDAASAITERRLNSLDTSGFSDALFISFKGTEGPGPHYRKLTVSPRLPDAVSGLLELAYNMWWAWHPEALDLFADIDPELWAATGINPVLFLEKVSSAAVEQRAQDPVYMKKYRRVLDEFHRYMEAAPRSYEGAEAVDATHPVAYFSMEFCIHECLPIYSGGLGVLSGDHLKSASDLGLPLVAVGLLYKNGYFEQRIDLDGTQVEQYPVVDPANLPVTAVTDANNQEVRVSVELPGRTVQAKVWKAAVGRVSLYLLDTDVEENRPEDRQISATLYGGGKRTRIEQEIVLGVGGVRFLEDGLHLSPRVYHLNEGHCGFSLFERIRRLMETAGMSFQEAREMVKASTVFTTHTPVPAGNETFSTALMTEYFSDVAPRLSISLDQLLETGFSRSDDANQEFSMTVLALKLSSMANGVSKLHGKVCQDMWHEVWPNLAKEEVPITSITNGIHIPSWIGPDIKRLVGQYVDVDWDNNQDDPLVWTNADSIPDDVLWHEHTVQKKRLISYVKEKLFEDYSRRGEDPTFIKESLEALDPDALTIGFARRFATYKRGTLLFRNRELLAKLLNDPERPVQILFAGKAHPADEAGKDLIRTIIAESRSPEFRGKIFFLENYNMHLARYLVQGVDLWLNTPVRPHEASGTSGMKIIANGGLNCSILDGWWDEAWAEHGDQVGWSILSTAQPHNRDHQDDLDSHALLNTLTNEIIPTFFDRADDGIPSRWIAKMKAGMRLMAPQFSTMRMVDEYHRRMYVPTASRAEALQRDEFKGIRTLTDWKRAIKARFSTVQIETVRIKGVDGDILPAGRSITMEVDIIPGRMRPEEIEVQLVIGPDQGDTFAEPPTTLRFEPAGQTGGLQCYRLQHTLEQSGTFRYAVRVVPVHPLLACVQETGLVHWA